ncbi:hypothetical protein EG327_007419 [Venturia inaequalis]|uniref:Uncharacterized protein n=1 Tax=Venturia inaequalis TaxID=5025 RepID=A0A8H3Z075_VENIN|nr:hypothetical protein EG327_007419 [Venturia inaequalis]
MDFFVGGLVGLSSAVIGVAITHPWYAPVSISAPVIPETITSTIIGSKTATVTLEPTTTVFTTTTSANYSFQSPLNSYFQPENSILQFFRNITPLVATITLLLIIVILVLAFRLWILVLPLKNCDCGNVAAAIEDAQGQILERLPEQTIPVLPPPERPLVEAEPPRAGSSTAQTTGSGSSGHPVQQPAGFVMLVPHCHCQSLCSSSCASGAQPTHNSCNPNPTTTSNNQSHGPTPTTTTVVQCNCKCSSGATKDNEASTTPPLPTRTPSRPLPTGARSTATSGAPVATGNTQSLTNNISFNIRGNPKICVSRESAEEINFDISKVGDLDLGKLPDEHPNSDDDPFAFSGKGVRKNEPRTTSPRPPNSQQKELDLGNLLDEYSNPDDDPYAVPRKGVREKSGKVNIV